MAALETSPRVGTHEGKREEPSPGRGRRGLPPGPRMPSALQAIGWARRPYPIMKHCQQRYGDALHPAHPALGHVGLPL